MSVESQFDSYFKAYNWQAKPVADLGWTFTHARIQGYLQVDAIGRWWHVVDGKVAERGSGLEKLKEYVADREREGRIRWTGKEPAIEHGGVDRGR